MIPKQDRLRPRTVEDLERMYAFKASKKQASDAVQIATDAKNTATGMITADYINALGIIAKGLSVEDLAALNATIGKWNITEDGLYTNNNTVGLNGAPGNPIRIYAGLEKREKCGGYITLDFGIYTSSTTDDGWIKYTNADNYVEHGLVLFDSTDLELVSVEAAEVRSRAASNDGNDAVIHSIRNVSYSVDRDSDGEVKVTVDSFESSSEITSNLVYMIFDLIYAVNTERANFRVHGNGDIDAENISSSSVNCSSITIDGIKMQRKVASNTDVTGTRTLTYSVSQDGKAVHVNETTGKTANTAHWFSILYKINGTEMWTTMVVSAGNKGGFGFIPSNIDDTITDVTFGDGTTVTSVTESYSDTFASEYLDIPHAVKAERLKIGNYELTEEKLAALLSLL